MNVQTYAFDENGVLMHCGPKIIRGRFGPATIRRWARQWRAWALARPADCPTYQTADKHTQTTWRIDWPDYPRYYRADGSQIVPQNQGVPA